MNLSLQLKWLFDVVALQRPVVEQYEVYRRLAVWYNLCVLELGLEGKKEIDLLYHYSSERGESILITLSELVEGKMEMPVYLRQHWSKFERLLHYLANGDAEIESSVSEEIKAVAAKHASSLVSKDLEMLI